MSKEKLPKFYELAGLKLKDLSAREKIIIIKITRNTAQMMIDAERVPDPLLEDVIPIVQKILHEYRFDGNPEFVKLSHWLTRAQTKG